MMAAKSIIHGIPLATLLDRISDTSGLSDISVTGLETDSRKVKPGYLFIAGVIGGISNISHINDAIKAGANALLVDECALPDPYLSSVPIIRAKDLYKKIGIIADRFYGHPSAEMTIIGVTGTNGKTSVSHLMTQCLSLSSGACGLIGTLGYGPLDRLVPGPHTTPEALNLHALLADFRDQKISQVVMEVSSHGLDQYRIAGIKFELAIFTNLSRDHLDYHQSMENYALSKKRLFMEYGIKKHVINIDDKIGETIFSTLPDNVQAVGCTMDVEKYKSRKKIEELVYGKIIDTQPDSMKMEISSPWGTGTVSTPLIGIFNARNILSVLSALCLSGRTFEHVLSLISGCENIPGRLELFENNNTPRVFIDYAHTPDALEQVLITLKTVCTGKLYCVFGCGGDRDQGKRPLMAQVAEKYADHITITSDNPRNENPERIIQDIFSGINDKQTVITETDRETAIRETIAMASVNDIVLIAGKGHENYQEIAGVRRPFSDQLITKNVLGIMA